MATTQAATTGGTSAVQKGQRKARFEISDTQKGHLRVVGSGVSSYA